MKKKWYRGYLTKGLWIVIEHLSLTVLAVCVMMVFLMMNAGIRVWSDGSENYAKSETLASKMYGSSLDIVYGIKYQNSLLENGSDQENRVIDLQEVDQGVEYTYKNTSGLAYSVEDLKKWASSSWSFYDGENILVCRTPDGDYDYYYYDDFLELIRTGKIGFIVDKGITDGYGESETQTKERILSMLENNVLQDGILQEGILCVTDEKGELKYEDVWNFGSYSLKEKYAPDGADSILDVINDSENWNGKLTEAYNILGSLLGTIRDKMDKVDILDSYKEGNTNLSYIYVDLDSGEIYSNRETGGFSRYKSVLEEMKKSGSYVIVSPTLSQCETDLNLGEYLSLKDWKAMITNAAVSDDYIFAVQTDSRFPIADSYAEEFEEHEKYAKWKMPVLQFGGFSALIFIVGLVWLTVTAGRKPEDEAIHLNSFDRWFTEVAVLVVFGLWASCFGMATVLMEYGTDAGYCVMSGIMGFVTAAFFLIGYLSLVRRSKAKTLWKGSLLRWFLGLWKKAWNWCKEVLELLSRNTGSKLKTMLFQGVFMAFQFVICGMIFNGGAVMILVLLGVDVAVLIFFLRRSCGEELILGGLQRIAGGELQYKIPLDNLYGDQKQTAEYINRIGEGLDAAVESSLKNERMKTELITNVSHDIKTPLTSIINYIDLLKRENFTDPKICGYLEVLEEKAQRLKVLTEDVVEASKASTGNISLEMADLDFVEMVNQVIGEFEEKFQEKNLTTMIHLTDRPAVIHADGRRMWRVLENVFNNVVKYAMEGTRVYIDVDSVREHVTFSMKNISAQPLNISADELTERFIRGDVSRNTEGSGLGLSIAKSLTELQGGEFRLYLDGDLFKVTIEFKGRN